MDLLRRIFIALNYNFVEEYAQFVEHQLIERDTYSIFSKTIRALAWIFFVLLQRENNDGCAREQKCK